MRITIDIATARMIDEIRIYCDRCENPCSTPYRKRADVIKAAIMKFVSMDCLPKED